MTQNNYLKVFFLLIQKLIDQYQRKDPVLMAKDEMGKYQEGSFHGGSNIKLKHIMCKDTFVVLLIPQS